MPEQSNAAPSEARALQTQQSHLYFGANHERINIDTVYERKWHFF